MLTEIMTAIHLDQTQNHFCCIFHKNHHVLKLHRILVCGNLAPRWLKLQGTVYREFLSLGVHNANRHLKKLYQK